jgi:hypothetical protein
MGSLHVPTNDEDRDAPRTPHRLGRSLVLVLLAGAVFLGTVTALRALVPWPEHGALGARMQHFLAHADDYDLLFVGSSNVAHGFDPAVVDAEFARRGHPLRSYSLAAEDMQPVEADFVLREVQKRRPARLRWVAIELLDFDPTAVIRDNAFSERTVYWHDGRSSWNALARLLRSGASVADKAQLAWLHLQHAAWRLGNLGEGDRAIAAWRAPADPASEAIVDAAGFEALDDRTDPTTLRMHARLLANAPRYRAQVAALDAHNAGPAVLPSGPEGDLAAQTARLRADGLEPVYVIPPVPHPTPALHAFAARADAPLVLAFNTPGRHPELFRIEHRYDETHLNRAGSEALSRRFADALADVLDRKQGD